MSRTWTPEQRAQAGARLAAARVRGKFVKRCTKQADAVEQFARHVKKQGSLQHVDLVVRRGASELHGIELKTRRSISGRKGRSASLSWRAMLELAHGKRHAITAVADSFSTSRSTVRSVTEFVAHAEIEWQGYHLRELQRMISQAGVHYAGMHMAWDETAELVSLNAVAEKTNASQRGSSWEVCVCHAAFLWGNAHDAQLCEVVCPPLPLISTAACHIDNALCGHPLVRPVQDFKSWLQNTVPLLHDPRGGRASLH